MESSDTVRCSNSIVLTDAALLITYRFLLEFVFGSAAAAEKATVWIVGPWIGYTLLAVALQLRPIMSTKSMSTSMRIIKGRPVRQDGTVDDVDLHDKLARLAVACLAVVVLSPQLRLLFVSEEALTYLVASAALYAIILPRVHHFVSVCLVAEGVLDLHRLSVPIKKCAIVVDLIIAAGMAAVVASHRTTQTDINIDAYWMIAKVLIVILYMY